MQGSTLATLIELQDVRIDGVDLFHEGTEAALASSALPSWTVLRNHWYFENLFRSVPGVLARGGKWFSAAGDGKLASISRDDLARAAACVLAGSYTDKTIYTLSGAQALTTTEQAQTLAQVLGRPIQVIPVPAEALIQGMESVLGKSPLAYFQDLRVERAVHLLRTSHQDIEAIATEVGYADGVTLRTLLRKRLGCGVKELRRAEI